MRIIRVNIENYTLQMVATFLFILFNKTAVFQVIEMIIEAQKVAKFNFNNKFYI